MAAECALNNGILVEIIEAHEWRQFGGSQDAYFRRRDELAAEEWDSLHALLADNAQRVAATIRTVADEALDAEIVTPYGTGPLSGLMAYPYWNMSYHEGQINYIASILGG